MRIVRSHLDCFTEAIAQVDSAIDTIVVEFENTNSLFRVIPDIDRNSVIAIIPRSATICLNLNPQRVHAVGPDDAWQQRFRQ